MEIDFTVVSLFPGPTDTEGPDLIINYKNINLINLLNTSLISVVAFDHEQDKMMAFWRIKLNIENISKTSTKFVHNCVRFQEYFKLKCLDKLVTHYETSFILNFLLKISIIVVSNFLV